jgi:hypothetical protein
LKWDGVKIFTEYYKNSNKQKLSIKNITTMGTLICVRHVVDQACKPKHPRAQNLPVVVSKLFTHSLAKTMAKDLFKLKVLKVYL